MSTEPVTKAVFRTFPSGDVIALFPRIPASVTTHAYCESYQHIGQHGAASTELPNTRPATPDEVAPLKSELERIGYVLEIRKRITGADHAARRAAWLKSRNH